MKMDRNNWDVCSRITADAYKRNSCAQSKENKKSFKETVRETKERGTQSEKTAEELDEDIRRLDDELKRIKEENKRERERREELRIKKRRLQRKIMEKLALKRYLARQDEFRQLNEKAALERMVGEDVYIEKPPLSKSLSAAEIKALCS